LKDGLGRTDTTKQQFHVLFTDVRFTREELVLNVAETDWQHVDPSIDERLAILYRSRSPWLVYSDDPNNVRRIYGFEMATLCAIGEEVIYSLLPKDQRDIRIENFRNTGLPNLIS